MILDVFVILKWAATYLWVCAPSGNTDQPFVQADPNIRLTHFWYLKVQSFFMQPAKILVRLFIGRASLKVRFITLRLKCIKYMHDRIVHMYRATHRSRLGPVVQSVVSLTSSLRVISLTVLADSIHNILIFFAEKMWVAFALQKLLTFFQRKISVYLRITRCKF